MKTLIKVKDRLYTYKEEYFVEIVDKETCWEAYLYENEEDPFKSRIGVVDKNWDDADCSMDDFVSYIDSELSRWNPIDSYIADKAENKLQLLKDKMLEDIIRCNINSMPYRITIWRVTDKKTGNIVDYDYDLFVGCYIDNYYPYWSMYPDLEYTPAYGKSERQIECDPILWDVAISEVRKAHHIDMKENEMLDNPTYKDAIMDMYNEMVDEAFRDHFDIEWCAITT